MEGWQQPMMLMIPRSRRLSIPTDLAKVLTDLAKVPTNLAKVPTDLAKVPNRKRCKKTHPCDLQTAHNDVQIVPCDLQIALHGLQIAHEKASAKRAHIRASDAYLNRCNNADLQ